MNIKKILIPSMIALVIVFSIGCGDKKNSELINENSNLGESSNIEEAVIPEEETEAENVKKFADYANIVNLSKDEIITFIGEEPIISDGYNLNFVNSGIEVLLGDIGLASEIPTRITFTTSDIDFDGVKIGANIDEFRNVYGKEFRAGDGYIDIKYNESLFLSIEYITNGEDLGKTTKIYLFNPME